MKALTSLEDGNNLVAVLSPSRKGKCGRKKKKLDMAAVKAIPLKQRRTFRSLAHALGVPVKRVIQRFKTSSSDGAQVSSIFFAWAKLKKCSPPAFEK